MSATDIESRSKTSDLDEDETFLKFNTLSGWKSLLLLQFQMQTSLAVICGLYVSYVLTLTEVAFAAGTMLHKIPVGNRGEYTSLIYAFDLFYFIDLISMLIFKNVKWSTITLSYKARHGCILFAEFLSIIPIDIVYLSMTKPNMKTFYFLRLRYVLRLGRLYDLYRLSKEYVGVSSHRLHLVVYLGVLLIISLTIGCVSYIYKCYSVNTLCSFQDYQELASSWYSSTTVFTAVGVTDHVGYDGTDNILKNITFSFVSFILNAYFISYFTCDVIHLLKPKFVYINICTRIKLNIDLWKKRLSEWRNYHKKIENLFDEYDYIYWERNKGVKPTQFLGQVIPFVMYKEIILDISWVPLKHSHLFRHEDVDFLRLLSTVMKHKFFFPGEVIYKRNEYKTSMVYIVSGIAEILSEEDGETPIMSLSSGTCLGEASLLLNYRSTCSVVSKNVCNVAVIERKDFMCVSDLYPAKYRRTLTEITARCAEAKHYQLIAEYQFGGRGFRERIAVLTMKWLKLTLRSLLFNVRKLGDLYSRHYLQKLEQNVFCTKYLDLLVIAEDVDLTADSVFIRNTFPFIFKDRSVLLNMWNTTVLILVVCLAVTYPYFAVFVPTLSLSYAIFHMVITFMWFVDLYLRMSTAIKTKYVSFVKLSDIVLHNLTRSTFLFDLLAAAPLEVVIYLIDCQLTERTRLICRCNRLLKLYKIEEFFQRARLSTNHHVVLKYTKFAMYMAFIYYYIAAILYLLGCPGADRCTALYEQFMFKYDLTTPFKKLAISLFTVIQFSDNLQVIDFPFFNTYTSYMILMFLEFALLVFNVYFISYISAAETLNKQDAHAMEEFSRNIKITMECFNLNVDLQQRIWTYVRLQFEYAGIRFLDGHTIFEHLPNDLFVISKNIHLGEYVRNIPLFHDLDEKIISQVCTIVSVHLFPPREVFKRIGEVCSEIHIIMEGSCSMATWSGETATLEPGDCFSVLESFLRIPSLITVTTLTQCKVISIDYKKIIAIILRNPVLYEQMKKTISQSLVAIEATPIEKNEQVPTRPSRGNIKSFGYRLKRRTKPYNEYHDGFPNWFVFKYILLRYTFYSNGNFVYYWEVGRCVFAFTTCIVVHMSCVSEGVSDGWYYARLLLDITAYCDIYFRHHVTYFNKKGLEVTHPYKTAKYYWKHGLLVDFLASFRLDLLKKTLLVEFFHLLQLYRLHALLESHSQKISTKGLSTMIKYIPYVLLFTNLFGSIVFRYFCTVKGGSVTCKNGTWVSSVHNQTRPFETYVFTIFFTASALISTCYGFISVADHADMLIFAVFAVWGYVFYNYLVAKTIASNLAINYDLISYQEAMKNLVNFMSYKRIDKRLRTELINHFEYMWNKTNGKSIHKSFAPFKTSFKVDALYNIYGMKFEKSTIFPSPNQSFFKSLLLDVKHEIYLKTGVVYRVNDINGIIYVLFKGQVEVIGADKNRLLTLHVGSVFGNLDDCPMGRRTLTMVASGHVEVLAVPSSVFHTHLKQFPKLNNHFRKLTIFNVDFLEESQWQPEVETTITVQARSSLAFTNLREWERKKSRCRPRIYVRNKYIKIWETVVVGAVSCGSYLFGIYHVATNERTIFFYLISYLFDLLYVIKIYLAFHTSYEDEFGNVISNRRQIAKRFIKTKLGFYFDAFTVVPFELAILFFLNDRNLHLIWAMCRLNRLARILNVIVYLRDMTQRLNINVFVIRTLYLVLRVILSQVTLGCCIIILGSLFKSQSTVTFESFVNSVKIITNTSAKLSTKVRFNPFNTSMALFVIFAGLFSKIIAIVYMAESCAILFVTNRTKYIYERFIIFTKTYMDSENVSPPLAERLFSYMKLLWTYNKGVQFPALLEETPYYLKEALLNSMFGFHFRKHPIMKNCHVDLIRQMTSQLKTLVLFPGDIVVYMGDIDHCMYFIQEGEVQAISEDTMYSEVVDFTLKAGDMFGFDQGIYYRCGHEYTYKISMYSILVSLKRDDWIYLLSFFPASKSLVYDKTKET